MLARRLRNIGLAVNVIPRTLYMDLLHLEIIPRRRGHLTEHSLPLRHPAGPAALRPAGITARTAAGLCSCAPSQQRRRQNQHDFFHIQKVKVFNEFAGRTAVWSFFPMRKVTGFGSAVWLAASTTTWPPGLTKAKASA